jgi:hypothetical protein
MSYTKLKSSIVTSTIWGEPHTTRIVWITMLALANKDGVVQASIPGLAHVARVTLEEAEHAIATLLAPDIYSRTKDYEGRRISECDGGWVLLNYSTVRDEWTIEDKRDYQRAWVAKKRLSKSVEVCRSESNDVVAPTPASNSISKKKERRATALPPDFGLNPERVAYASKRGIRDVERVMEAFRAYHQAKGSTMKDWNAAWQSWCMKEPTYSAGRQVAENKSNNLRKSDTSILSLCKSAGINTHGKSRDELLQALQRHRT